MKKIISIFAFCLLTGFVFADDPSSFTPMPDEDFGSSLSSQVLPLLTIKNMINIIVSMAMAVKLIITVFKVAKGRGDESWEAIMGWGVGLIIWELVMNYLV